MFVTSVNIALLNLHYFDTQYIIVQYINVLKKQYILHYCTLYSSSIH